MNKVLTKKRNSKMIGLDDCTAPSMPADEWLKNALSEGPRYVWPIRPPVR